MSKLVKGSTTFGTKEAIPAKVSIAEMVMDEYQGHVNNSIVTKIASAWDPSAAGVVILNLREDNTYAVLDGQHRVLAAQKVGVKELNALVFIGKTRNEEARLFVQLNTKHNVSALDRFNAGLFSGGSKEREIARILKEVGLYVPKSPTNNPDAVNGIHSVIRVYDNFGAQYLRTVAGILTSAYHEYADRRRGYQVGAWEGVAQFLHRYPEADIRRLIEKMREKSPTVLAGSAELQRGPGQEAYMGWGKALTGLYNSGFRSTYRGYLNPVVWTKKKWTPAGAVVRTKAGRASMRLLKQRQQQERLAAKKAKR